MTTFLTVLAGVLTLVLGQMALRFIVEPLQEFRKLRGEIAHSLIYYANVGGGIENFYVNKIEQAEESEQSEAIRGELTRERHEQLIRDAWQKADDAQIHLRQQASQLRALPYTILFYKLWVRINLVPPFDDVSAASSALIGLSNSVHGAGASRDRAAEIRKMLRLVHPE